jgi:sugar O-acyltransferase (sialic acid O-acetyltransferase NeuD family)
MSSLPVIIVGAGGHAAVVADALLAAGVEVLGFTDADTNRRGGLLCGLQVLGDDQVLARYDLRRLRLANGLGSLGNDATPLRYRVQTGLETQGWQFCSIIHPSASVSRFAMIGPAAQIMAGCVVQAGASLGAGVILNTRAVVEHDARIGAWCHVAPGAVVCGQVKLGPHCHIGAGAVIKQGLELGPHSLVGIGAAVVTDFSGHGVLVGVPAKPIDMDL